MQPSLTYRRDPNRANCWFVYYGDVQVGTIARASAIRTQPRLGTGKSGSIPVSTKAGVPQHVRVWLPARSTMRAMPAVPNGEPRPDVKTKVDFGSCSLPG